MQDQFVKMLFFGLLYAIEFGTVYIYGRKHFPRLALRLTIGTFILLLIVSFYSGALGGFLSFIALVSLLFMFRKPDQTAAFQQFYADNKLYASVARPPAVMQLLGDKGWISSEGFINKSITEQIKYFFWLGSTSSTVSTGQYSRTTVYTSYLAFIFPPGAVSTVFKQRVLAAADKSNDSFKRKLKSFFVRDTERPSFVATAADGSFIIQYIAVPDIDYYARRLQWIKENIGKLYLPAAEMSFAPN